MKNRHKTSPPDPAVAEAAASWLLRIQDGFSQSEFREWRRWLTEDEAHAEAFDGVSAFWRVADEPGDLPWPTDEELAADTYDGNAALPLPETLPRSGRRQRGLRQRVAGRFWPAVAASIIAISLVGLLLAQRGGTDSSAYQTATAEHRTVMLQDGSSITLGAESYVLVAFDRETRRVELRSGEAYFRVAKDKLGKDRARPFVVAAGTRTIRALGTEFDINIGVRDIKVAVVEGRVRVERHPVSTGDPADAPRAPDILDLGSGDVLDFGLAGDSVVVSNIDPRLSTSWLSGRLAYDGMPLESVIADVNRYTPTELIIGDEATKQLVFTGTIFSDDIDNWLAGLEDAFPLRLVPVDGERILLIQSEI